MKKKFNRCLSVVMATLMLLTCWVFFAPEQKAGAVDQENYEYEVYMDIVNNYDDDNSIVFTYRRPDNSTGTYTINNVANTEKNDNGAYHSFSLNGALETMQVNIKGLGWDIAEWYVTSVIMSTDAGGVHTLFAGKFGCKKQNLFGSTAKCTYTFVNRTFSSWTDEGSNSATTVNTAGLFAYDSVGVRPYAKEMAIEDQPDEVQIPNDGSTDTSSWFSYQIRDQYGARLGSSYYNKVSCNSTNSTEVSNDSVKGVFERSTSEYEYYRINVKNAAKRWLNPAKDQFQTSVYMLVQDKVNTSLIAKVKDGQGNYGNAYISVTLMQPEYTISYTDYAGGRGATIDMPTTDAIYNMPIPAISSADKAGYTLLGFYTTGGNTQNSTAPSSFGTQVTSSTRCDGNMTFRAGWQANECTVTVLNNDNQPITTYKGRYNETLSSSNNNSYNFNTLKGMATYVRAPGESGENSNMQITDFYVTDSKEYTNSTDQAATDKLNGQSIDAITLKGDVTVKAAYHQVGDSKYTVKFIDKGTQLSSTEYAYDATISNVPANPSVPTTSGGGFDLDTYTYSFLGWAEQRYDTDSIYFMDVDEAGTPNGAIALVNVGGLTVTRDHTFVGVYGRAYNQYSATFHYKQDGHAQTTYTQQGAYHWAGHVKAPGTVEKTNADTNETYTENTEASYIAEGYTYDFNGWYTSQANADAGTNPVDFNSASDTAAVMNNRSGKDYYAGYTRGAITKNLINFYTADGELLETAELDYSATENTAVPAMAASAEAQLRDKELYEYEENGTRYSFDTWVNLRGGTETPYSVTPQTPAEYYPKYTANTLYTITLLNGENELYSFTGINGEGLTVSTLGTTITAPTRSDDLYAKNYVFQGWAKDSEGYIYKDTDTLITDLSTVTINGADVNLYARFAGDLIDYTVHFYRDDGTTLIGGDTYNRSDYHYGDPLTAPTLTDADKTKEETNTYTFDFMGWNLEPTATVVGDAEYYLTFRQMYKYYTVVWQEPSRTASGTYTTYKTEQYIYNEVLRQPIMTNFYIPTSSDPAKKTVFDHWTYADGSQYYAGHRLTDARWDDTTTKVITLTPQFKDVDRTVLIHRYDGLGEGADLLGSEIDTIEVEYGKTMAEVQLSDYEPQYTETQHYRFNGWKLYNGYTLDTISDSYSFGVDGSEEVTVAASYIMENHGAGESSWLDVVTKDPTFAEEGVMSKECSYCHYRNEAASVAKLQDTTEPTARLYIKDSQWDAYVETLNSSTPIPAALNNIIIVNSFDMANSDADVAANTPFNASGSGSGVDKIEVSIVKLANAGNPQSIQTWYTAYQYEDVEQPNASMTIGNLLGANEAFGSLSSGDRFVIYTKVTDRATEDNVPDGETAPNVTYLRSDTLILDTTAPTVTVTSSDNLQGTTRHCVDATFTCTDTDLVAITLNGNDKIDVDGTETSLLDLVQTGVTLNEAGQYQVVATDRAGNMTKVNFEIIGEHITSGYAREATCTQAGEISQKCTVCGTVLEETKQVIDPLGHNWKLVLNKATCLVDGNAYEYCTRCGVIKDGDPVLTDEQAASLVAPGHHTWPTDSQAYVLKAATCSTEGMRRYRCVACGEVEIRAYGPLDPTGAQYTQALEDGTGATYGHEFYSSVTTPATCFDDGVVTQDCKYCGKTFTLETLDKLTHTPSTENFEVLTAATCTEAGSKAPYCANDCGTLMQGGDFGDTYVTVIPALGHDLQFDHTVAPTATEQGYDLYKCSRCDYTVQRNFVDPTTTYTVSAYNVMLNEEGATVVNGEPQTKTVALGSTVSSSDFTNPQWNENNQDNTYRYTFAGWSKELPNMKLMEEALADDASEEAKAYSPTLVSFPLTVEADTAIYAVYSVRYVYYTIALYDYNKEFLRNDGFHYYGQVISPNAPQRPADALGTYEFNGWLPMEQEDGYTYTPSKEITVNGDAAYYADYKTTQNTYTVFWVYNDVTLHKAVVNAGADAEYTWALPQAEDFVGLEPTAEGHYVFTGWSVPTTNVTRNLRVAAKFELDIHDFAEESTQQDCETGAGVKRTCTVCNYVETETINDPLGHNWKVTATVYPTVRQDGTYDLGSVSSKCERCGATKTEDLAPIELDVTVKDSNGAVVEGAKVTVYDGDTKIMSRYSNSAGVAELLVPQDKEYRIVVEYGTNSYSGKITVDQNGNITGGGMPTVPASVRACPKNCTCHKKGFWPNIYRAIHKFIYMLTRTKCCPDASYL